MQAQLSTVAMAWSSVAQCLSVFLGAEESVSRVGKYRDIFENMENIPYF